MVFLLFCLIFLLKSVLTSTEPNPYYCSKYWKPSTYRKADIILGAFIPIYITMELTRKINIRFDQNPYVLWEIFMFRWKNYHYMLTLYFAIEEINKDSHLLPNVTLGFHLYNAFISNLKTLEGPLMWLTGRSEYICNYNCKTQHKALGVLSGIMPEFSAAIGTLLELYKVPQVTYGPFDTVLSDKGTFPSLYQVSPKDRALTQAVISLLLHFGWKWVGLFVADDLKGKEFLSQLEGEITSEDICVAFTLIIPVNWNFAEKHRAAIANLNQYTEVNVEVFYGDVDDLLFFCLQNNLFLTGRKVWIMAKQHFTHLETIFNEKNDRINIFRGSLSFSKKRMIPGLKKYLEALTPSQYPGDLYFNKFWVDHFYCSPPDLLCGNLRPCPSNISLKSKQEKHDVMTISEPSYSIWNAVYAVAHALHKMMLYKTELGSHEDINNSQLLPWQVPDLREHIYLCSVILAFLSWGEMFISVRELRRRLKKLRLFKKKAMSERDKIKKIIKEHPLVICMNHSYPNDVSLQLHHFLRTIQVTNAAGDEINFDKNNNIMEKYNIQNFMEFTNYTSLLVKVGEFVSKNPQDQDFFINEVLIKWPSNFNQTPQSVCTQSCAPGFWKVLQEGRPVCCFSCIFCPEGHISNQTDQQECIPCQSQEYPNPERNHCLPKSIIFLSFEDPLGMALACTALCFCVITAIVLGIFLKHQDSPIVKANNRTLSYILLISILLCFLCPFLFIGHPNTASCILQQITFALVFTLALSTVLAKTITVIMAFRVMKPGRTMRRLFVSGIYNSVIPICLLIQFILCGVWLGTSPPYIDTDVHSEHAHVILLCNKGSVTAFYCVLGYLGILALGSYTVAFLVRNLPDTFNEAKFLTFSMLLFMSVWVTFLPVYHSTKGKAMVAVEIFSILSSSAGLLGCIFFPKCYIILLRPDKISLRCLKTKGII